MPDSNDFSLVPHRSNGVEKAEPKAKLVLTVMVSDAVAMARSSKVATEAIYRRGLKLYCNKEHLLAASLFKEAALLGNPAAQNYYGYLLWKGLVMTEHGTEWLDWLKSSAEQGYVKAQFRLGEIFYRRPNAIRWPHLQPEINASLNDPSWQELWAKPAMQEFHQAIEILNLEQQKSEPLKQHIESYVESAKWYRMAAELGHSTSQNHLAQMYQKGSGLPLDNMEALKWHRQAGEQGNFLSQLELTYLYHSGLAVPKNDLESERWYRLACEKRPKRVEWFKKLGWSQEFGWSKAKIKPLGII